MDKTNTETQKASLFEFISYFVRLGSLGFGGPIALVGYMQRDLVEAKQWITQEEYREGLSLAQLAPGPLAAQLAIYLGWVRAGVWGATLVGLAFILPSFLMVLILSWLYTRYGGLDWIRGAFYGIGAAVIAIMVQSGYKLVKRNVGRDRVLAVICGASALVTAITESEIVWVFLGGGILNIIIRNQSKYTIPTSMLLPPFLITGLHEPAAIGALAKIFLYFAEAGAFIFGSGLAIVPFLHAGVVNEYKWLTEQQFLDAVAIAMITPGPVVITVAFIGYLVAGAIGGTAAALGVFLPCYLLVVFPAPYYHKLASKKWIKEFVDGVTAAAVGAIVGAAYVLGKRALIDPPTVGIAVVGITVMFKVKKFPEPLFILIAGIAGYVINLLF